MGWVYVSKCRQFMVVHARDGYNLSYSGPVTKYVSERLGQFPSLKAAKEAAEVRRTLYAQ